jgi:hypothetical protein
VSCLAVVTLSLVRFDYLLVCIDFLNFILDSVSLLEGNFGILLVSFFKNRQTWREQMKEE